LDRLTGATSFTNNGAYKGGAIYYTGDDDTTTTYPADTIFEGNSAEVSLLLERFWSTL